MRIPSKKGLSGVSSTVRFPQSHASVADTGMGRRTFLSPSRGAFETG